jgi:AraC-like DNA-binding protein
MDPIAGLLDGPRARRAFLLRCTLDPPWALHIRDEAPLSLVAMLRGRACFVLYGRRLLDALPPRLVLRRDEWETPALGLLAAEMLRDEVGQDAVLDRLLDLLLIDAVRTYFARTEQTAPGWYRAQRDPVVGQAVRLLQESPAEAWTIGALASQTRVSRATLARRFAEVVGQPPMEFLTEWRLTLAADLILDPRETVGSVARAVGYGSPYALSAAFKRVRGVSPHEHRIAQRPVTAEVTS